ncbi:SH3 domain-containing protein [Novosphingobium sp. 1949]|uniref:SH3 domain-containing protein n=1 Tax=Novosphingobium organovorum TaxID=2930092 RepID=A0ABT0B7W7_9SPHN|nr:SH3 domain-containing protein [Novosphingobium organovorum]MCJ2181151.1 SH3 domain-containing protein [Novosphingobium organovorum]
MRCRYFLAAALGLALIGSPAFSADEDKVPYWASIDTDVANMRVGPGNTFRIDWVYRRLHLPVKVLRREGPWRQVEDPDGARGWIRDVLLSRQRGAMVRADGLVEMHQAGASGSPVLWKVEPGVVGLLGECDKGWCAFEVAGHKGFVEQDRLWGAQNL